MTLPLSPGVREGRAQRHPPFHGPRVEVWRLRHSQATSCLGWGVEAELVPG